LTNKPFGSGDCSPDDAAVTATLPLRTSRKKSGGLLCLSHT